MIKKIITVLLACLMVMTAVPVFASAQADAGLRFDDNGEFRIMKSLKHQQLSL